MLLQQEGELTTVTTLARLPLVVTGQVLKQLQKVLSSSNSHIGKPFLEGNFAPTQSELFVENLQLITKETIAVGDVNLRGPTAIKTTIKSTKGTKSGTCPNSTLLSCTNSNFSISSTTDSNTAADDAEKRGSHQYNGLHTTTQLNAEADNDTWDVPDQQKPGTPHWQGSGPESGVPAASELHPKLYGAASLPAALSGAFLRVGPNPYLPSIGGYHWFDGDGMVHAVRIKDGKASYCNRWVPTSRLKQEVSAGWPVFPRLGDYMGLRGLLLILLSKVKTRLGVIDGSAGGGTANTALVCHASRLLALSEGDMPYALRMMCSGLLEAVGRLTVSGPVGKSFTAHPKLDPVTGELHFFRYTFEAPPYVSYGVLGPSGGLINTVHISKQHMPRPVMMHDFAITENYVVILDNPLCFDGERMVKQNNLPFSFKADQGSRVGLLRRGAADDSNMIWIKLPAHMVFHVANAWEEPDGRIKIFAAHHWSISLNLDTRSTGKIPDDEQPRIAVITVNPNNPDEQGSIRIMTKTVGDFPCIHPRFVGRKCRYAYVATMVIECGDAVKWNGVAKIDLWAEHAEDAEVGKIKLPVGCYNGETVFLPRSEDPSQCASEDDGYLITYVHDDSTAADDGSSSSSGSSLVIWDALTMSSQPLAVIQMPARVPYGFHAYWMNETQVQQQMKGNPLAHVSAAV